MIRTRTARLLGASLLALAVAAPSVFAQPRGAPAVRRPAPAAAEAPARRAAPMPPPPAGAPLTPPQPLPMPPAIPAPQDVDYAGTIRLSVDATDTDRKVFRVRETIPVTGGRRLTLLYPKWLPGNHKAAGPIEALAGLTITAGGQRLPWTRDPVEVYAFHVDVPAGVSSVEASFQFVSPVETRMGRVVMTPEMLNLQWNAVVLYPAGHYARRITVEPSVTLPQGWSFGVALDGARTRGGTTTFAPTTLETLVDSPMFAGRNYKQVDLDPGGRSPVRLHIVADKPEQLAATEAQIAPHRAMVREADALFGARHFNHYDFLFALSDEMSGIGLEHHRSSENGVGGDYFTDWKKNAGTRDLLPHEFTHSWNGKHRRGADLWTANFEVPMRDSLLWVYEGQTQYWGEVLTARAGLNTKGEYLDFLALTAANFDRNRPGRAWKPLIDTTNDPITNNRRPQGWRSYQRSEDYYSEGALVWLDADTLIRERSGGRRSLDDFARRFFGQNDGSWAVHTYTFDDVVAALNAVEPYDWASFLRTRLERTGEGAPLDGLARGGYRLVYGDTPSDTAKTAEAGARSASLLYSLGFTVGAGGTLSEVSWGGPGYTAGLTTGQQLVAVNGTSYDADKLRKAVTDAKASRRPIELLVKSGDRFRTVSIPYYDGLRYPRLERIAGTPDRLGDIVAARAAGAAAPTRGRTPAPAAPATDDAAKPAPTAQSAPAPRRPLLRR